MTGVKHFLRFATDYRHLADLTKYISYGPTRKLSQSLVGQHAVLGEQIDMAPHMPTNPQNKATGTLFNYAWWADHRDELDARFQAWLAR